MNTEPEGKLNVAAKNVNKITEDKILLNFSMSHFINYPQLLASRLQDHSSTGNIFCHLIAGPMLGASSFYLLLELSGSEMLLLLINLVLSIWSIVTDPLYGIIYSFYTMLSSYFLLHTVAHPSSFTCLALILLAILIQLGIGHMLCEQRPPNELEGVVKGEGYLFAVLDLTTEVVLATFHFYSILMLKFGFRPNLKSKVDAELKGITRVIGQKKH